MPDPQIAIDSAVVVADAASMNAMKGAGAGTTGAILLNLAMSAALNPKLEKLWRRQRFWVRPSLLIVIAAAGGVGAGIAAGLDIRASVASAFAGLVSSLAGSPSWRMIFEKAADEAEEESSMPNPPAPSSSETLR